MEQRARRRLVLWSWGLEGLQGLEGLEGLQMFGVLSDGSGWSSSRRFVQALGFEVPPSCIRASTPGRGGGGGRLLCEFFGFRA